MRNKIAALVVTVTVAFAATVPVARAAHAKPAPGPSAPAAPGFSFPDLSALFSNLGVTPNGSASFLFRTLAGPLANAGAGFLMNAIGLDSLLHIGSKDAVALRAIRSQLDDISKQLKQISTDLNTLQGAVAQSSLDNDLADIKVYASTTSTVFNEAFVPMADAGLAVDNASPADLATAEKALLTARNNFYFDYQIKNIGAIPAIIHAYLVPGGARTSALAKLGVVLLSRNRYLTAFDSAQIRTLYNDVASTEALASWMKIERWTPSDPAPTNGQLPGNTGLFHDAQSEFLDNTVAEFVNLPPMIPTDAVIDAYTGALRTTTNNVKMFMPATDTANLTYRPGVGGPGSVPDALAAMNTGFAGGLSDWEIPTQSILTSFLTGFSTADKTTQPTPDAFLAALNPTSTAWQVIGNKSWPFLWTTDQTTLQTMCTNGLPVNVPVHNVALTTGNSVVWTWRPSIPHVFSTLGCAAFLAPYFANALGGLLAVRSTGTMAIDYMAQGQGPNIKAGAILRRTDLSNFNLTGVNLTGADLRGSNLDGATLQNATFTNANLAGVSAQTITGAPASLPAQWSFVRDPNNKKGIGFLVGPGADLTGANLSGVDLSQATLTGVTTGGINCTGCTLPPGWRWTGLPSGYLIGPGVDLTGIDLTGTDLTGANLTNANLTNANLTNANLTNVNLTNTIVTGAKLSVASVAGVTSGGISGTPATLPAGSRLVNGYLAGPGVKLVRAGLTGADLTGVDLTGADLTNAVLTNAVLTNATLIKVVLTGANITNAVFLTDNDNKLAGITSGGIVGLPMLLPISGRFRIVQGYFVGPSANLSGAVFTQWASLGISLSGTNFTGASLVTLNFTGAYLNNAILTDADMRNVTVGGANLTNATLTGVRSGGITGQSPLPPNWSLVNGYLVGPGANLQGASLSNTNLSGGLFVGTNFDSANLSSADFTNANLEGANLTGANLTSTIWSNTRCPNGVVQSTPCPTDIGPNGPTEITLTASSGSLVANIDPTLGNDAWTVVVQQLAVNGGWIAIGTYTTHGSGDAINANLPAGTYRVYLPYQGGYLASTSNPVTLTK